MECGEPPRRQRPCSHPAPFWATSDFASLSQALETAHTAWICSEPAYLWATSNSFSALKCWGPPKPQRLYTHRADLWATCDATPLSEALGTAQAAGVR